ncbi:ABC transporter ATP-binding protein [Propionigenium maris DSM 9537]|uniref:ABC transporter ATP-binding protein n=1 Tax=Propionigenium maris DSM 9537 TaxID=1123000 RepID=A0A9W6GG37_9FUSO|nr:ATP-binding cassette domain-containing protein [Propionigenium maris]GLI54624.1 ABC transporter ATP-binding protein [Propionigenium maris DSM 9537]
MLQVAINKLKKYYGANLILDNTSLELIEGEKVGLIGKNGSGKSTIFKIIAGVEGYEEGSCVLKKDLRVGYLIQDFTPYLEKTVREVLYSSFESLLELERKLREALMELEDYESDDYEERLSHYGKLQEEFEVAGGYEIEEKVKRVRLGLNIPEDFLEKRIGELSGGEKNRIFLAKALVDEPEVLLLDEPTNHLDLKSIKWLEEFIGEYRKTVFLISHDRYFLDRTVKKIYELDESGVETYSGNYSYYVVERERRYLKALEAYLAQEKEIKRMEDAIRRFRHWGSIADNKSMFIKAENMRKRIERMERVERPRSEREIKLDLEMKRRSGRRVLKVEDVSKTLGGKLLFQGINLNLYLGERVGIIGENGSGKTTLLNMILAQEEGVTLGSNLRIAYLDQNLTFEDYSMTLKDVYRREAVAQEGEIHRNLAKFHFYEEDLNKKIGSLSGGEKARVKLAIMIDNGFNLLILDEPTNHLDLQFKETLEEALLDFEGTVLFISHDRYFLNKVSQRIVELKGGTLIEYPGNFDYYLEKNTGEAEPEVKPQRKENTRVRDNWEEKERERKLKKLKREEETLLKILEDIEARERSAENDYMELSKIHGERVEAEGEYEKVLERLYQLTDEA